MAGFETTPFEHRARRERGYLLRSCEQSLSQIIVSSRHNLNIFALATVTGLPQ